MAAVARRGQETRLEQEGSLGNGAFGCPIRFSQGNGVNLAPNGLGWGGLLRFLGKFLPTLVPALRFCVTRSQARRTRSLPQLPQQKPGGSPREADPSVLCSLDDALPDDKLVSEQSPLENPPVTSTARGRCPKATSRCKAQAGSGLSAKHLPRRANRGGFRAFLPCKSHRDSQGQLKHSSALERPAHTRICLFLNKISPRGYLKKTFPYHRASRDGITWH